MNDFSKSIIKWIVIGLIILLVVILVTNIVNSNSGSSTPNDKLVDNSYESGMDREDDYNDLDSDSFSDDLSDLEQDAYFVDAPDTANSPVLLNIIGLAVTTTGIIYIFKNRIRKTN